MEWHIFMYLTHFFLTTKEENIIHGDLAARNILVSHLGEELRIRITDFGCAVKEVEDQTQTASYSGHNLPFRWCAPEVLQSRCPSKKGDIWAFGIYPFDL